MTTTAEYEILRIAERRAELIAAADARRLARRARAAADAPAPRPAPTPTRRFHVRLARRFARRTTVAPA